MKKLFLDCGVREGDAIAAFLGDRNVGYGQYYNCLKRRGDAQEFELMGFESPDFKYLQDTRTRFEKQRFTLIERLIWIEDGLVEFDSDGESYDCRVFQVSKTDGAEPWRHPNQNAVIKKLPCIDFAKFLMDRYHKEDYIIVKMDIEGAEYDVLKKLIDTNAVSLVKELYVEYHWWGNTKLRPEIESYMKDHNSIYYRNDWP